MQTKQLRETKKKQIQTKRCKFYVKPSDFTNMHFHNIYFKFSISLKMRRNDAVSKRNVEHVKQVIRVARSEIIKSKSYSSKPRWIFLIPSVWSRDIVFQVLYF